MNENSFLVVENIKIEHEDNKQLIEMNQNETISDKSNNWQTSPTFLGIIKFEEEFDFLHKGQLNENIQADVLNDSNNFQVNEKDLIPKLEKFASLELVTNICETISFKEESALSNEVKIEIEDHQILPETVDIHHDDALVDKSVIKKNDIIKLNEESEILENVHESKIRHKPLHKCDHCEYATPRRMDLNRHLKTHDKQNVQKFYCNDCSFSTIHKGSLTIHFSTHKPSKQFHCEICQKYFNYKYSFKMHMNTHHPDACQDKMQVYQCEKCPYKSVYKKDFRRHKIKHGDTENRTKYECSKCDFSSYYKGDLNKHMLIHSDRKLLVCEHCGYSCRFSSNLKSHMTRRHNKPV